MFFQFNRIGRVVFLFASITLVLSFASLFYYLQIKQNERYQNQLHFRELSQIQGAMENGLEGFSKLGTKFQQTTNTLATLNDDLIKHFQTRFNKLKDALEEREKIYNDYVIERKDWYALLDKNNQQKELVENKKNTLDEMAKNYKDQQNLLTEAEFERQKAFDKFEEVSDSFISPEEIIEEKYLSQIIEQCQSHSTYCEKLEQWYDDLFSFHDYQQLAPERIEAEYKKNYYKIFCKFEHNICKQKTLQSEITAQLDKLSKLRGILDFDLLIKQNKQTLAKQLNCQNEAIWYDIVGCERLTGLILDYNAKPEHLETSVELVDETAHKINIREQVKSLLNQQQQQLKFLIETENSKNRLIDDIAHQASALQLVVKFPALIKNYALKKQTAEQLSANLDEVQSNLNSLEQKVFTPPERDTQTDTEKQQFERYNSKRMDYIRLDKESIRLHQSIEEEIQKLITKTQSNKSSILTVFGIRKGEDKLPYLTCLRTALDKESYHISVCAQIMQNKSQDQNFKNNLKNYIYESLEVTKAAFPSINYKLNNSDSDDCSSKSPLSNIVTNNVNLLPPEQTQQRGLWQLSIPLVKETYKVQSNCIDPHSDYLGKFTISLGDLFPDKTNYFPLVLLVDNTGRLIYRHENIQADAFQSGLYFELTDEILKSLANKQEFKPANKENKHTETDMFPGYSGQIEILIAGESYSVFISPWSGFTDKNSDPHKNDSPLYYLIGITPKSKLLVNKLSIPNSTLVAVVFCLLAVVALIPLLKIRLVSLQQAFSKPDRHHVAMGLSLLMILLLAGTIHFVIYTHWKERVEIQNEITFKQIKNSFQHEIKMLLSVANKEKELIRKGVTKPGAHIFAIPDERFFLENAFFLKYDGKLEVGDFHFNNEKTSTIFGKWSTDLIAVKSDLDLAKRQYFDVAKNCKGWLFDLLKIQNSNVNSSHDSCKDTLYMQRIMSLVDGRKTTQFSMPLYDAKQDIKQDTKSNTHIVYSFGARLQTFFAPLLPANSGFAVFENATGNVLYHSNDERSLVENMFVETDNDNELRSTVRASLEKGNVEFISTYRGKTHLFVVGKLHKAIPWTLVVFHDKETLRNISMLMGFSGVILLLLLLLLCQIIYLLLQATGKGYVVRSFTWFNLELARYKVYGRLSLVLFLYSALALGVVFYFIFSGNAEIAPLKLASLIFFYWLIFWGIIVTARRMLVSKQIKQVSASHNNSAADTLTRSKKAMKIITSDLAYLSPSKADATKYSVYLIVLLYSFWSIPTFLVMGGSANFYLQKFADRERLNFIQQYKEAVEQRKAYSELLIDAPAKANIAARNAYESLIKKHNQVFNFNGLMNDSKEQTFPTYETAESISDEFKKHWLHVSGLTRENGQGLHSSLWRNIHLGFELASDIWLNSKLEKDASEVNVNPAVNVAAIFADAIANHWRAALLLILFGFVALWWFINKWVCMRMMGLFIPQNLRLNDSLHKRSNRMSLLKQMAITNPEGHIGQFAQVIRPTGQTKRIFTKHPYKPVTDTGLSELIDRLSLLTEKPVSIGDIDIGEEQSVQDAINKAFNLESEDVAGTAVLTGLEMVAMDKDSRIKALQILGYLVSRKHLNVILLVDIAPLFRLTRQLAYPGASEQEQAPVHEVVRWARLLKRFVKFYDWTPRARRNLPPHATSYQTLIYESRSWPDLKIIYHEFLEYHCNVKDVRYEYKNDKNNKSKKIFKDNKKISKKELINSINEYWLPEQVIEFFAANAGANYRYRWELCTKEERLLLIQLSNNHVPNPLNLEPIEHMVRRGYLYQYNGWHIVNQSFSRFVLTAEPELTVAEWMSKASESSWKYIRVPIFVVMLVMFSLLAYTASDAFESIIAILTAILGILPLAIRGIGMARGDTNSVVDN